MVGGLGSAGIAQVGSTLGAEMEAIYAVAEGDRRQGGGIGWGGSWGWSASRSGC